MATKTITISDISGEPAAISVGWDESYIDGAGSRASELVQRDLTTSEAQRLLNHLAQDPKVQDDIIGWVDVMKERAKIIPPPTPLPRGSLHG